MKLRRIFVHQKPFRRYTKFESKFKIFPIWQKINNQPITYVLISKRKESTEVSKIRFRLKAVL